MTCFALQSQHLLREIERSVRQVSNLREIERGISRIQVQNIASIPFTSALF